MWFALLKFVFCSSSIQAFEDKPLKVKISPKGGKVLISYLEKAAVLDLDSGQVMELNHGSSLNAAVFSPDVSKVATAGKWDRNVYVWDLSSNSRLSLSYTENTSGIHAVKFSTDGNKLLSVGARVKIWNVSDGSWIKDVMQVCANDAIDFNPDGKSVSLIPLGVEEASNHVVYYSLEPGNDSVSFTNMNVPVDRFEYVTETQLLLWSAEGVS